MVLESKYLIEAYRNAMIKQLSEKLEAEGYKITFEKSFDLKAIKNNIIKVYEFKFRNSSKTIYENEEMVNNFINRAKEIGAEPIVIYMSSPNKANIEYNDLGHKIMEYLIDNFPDELDELSTHTSIEEVYIEQIYNISIDNVIHLDGDATICVILQYGSDSDSDDEDDDESTMSFPMDFSVVINWNETIEELAYNINTESFYE